MVTLNEYIQDKYINYQLGFSSDVLHLNTGIYVNGRYRCTLLRFFTDDRFFNAYAGTEFIRASYDQEHKAYKIETKKGVSK